MLQKGGQNRECRSSNKKETETEKEKKHHGDKPRSEIFNLT